MGLLDRDDPVQLEEHAVKAEAPAAAASQESEAPDAEGASERASSASPVPSAAPKKAVRAVEPVPAFAPEVKQQLGTYWAALHAACQALRPVERYKVAAIAYRRCT